MVISDSITMRFIVSGMNCFPSLRRVLKYIILSCGLMIMSLALHRHAIELFLLKILGYRLEVGPSIKYVSLCVDQRNGDHGIGNNLFLLSAMMFTANRTGRRIALPRDGYLLDGTFDLDVTRVEDVERDLCPCQIMWTSPYNFDERLADEAYLSKIRNSHKTLLVCGHSQTFRYVSAIKDSFNERVKFLPNIETEAGRFLRETSNKYNEYHSQSPVFRVGVHIRRGDFLLPENVEFGLTVINNRYLDSAFKYFTSRHTRVLFIIATIDLEWTIAHLPIVGKGDRITFSNKTAGVDLAILTKCDAVIASTGSFGWWAAWLANGTTTYYSDWPRSGSVLHQLFHRENYFPPEWIPIS